MLRQQQELFARARESALLQERQQLEASNGASGEQGEGAETRGSEGTEESNAVRRVVIWDDQVTLYLLNLHWSQKLSL